MVAEAPASGQRLPGDRPHRPVRGSARLVGSVIAIVGGLATAVLWATTLLGSARSARLIGSWSTLGWVMLVGLVGDRAARLFTSPPVQLTQYEILHLTAAGIANSGGLLLVYTALRRGKVGVVGPIVSTEGAIGATLAILAGDPISGPAHRDPRPDRRRRGPCGDRSRDPPVRMRQTATVSADGHGAARARRGRCCSGSTSTPRAGSRPTCRSPGPSCRPASPASSA